MQCNFNFLDQRILDLKILDLIKKDKSTLYARTILNFGIFTEAFLKKINLNLPHMIIDQNGKLNKFIDGQIMQKK